LPQHPVRPVNFATEPFIVKQKSQSRAVFAYGLKL
jgi:hypothetical protein